MPAITNGSCVYDFDAHLW